MYKMVLNSLFRLIIVRIVKKDHKLQVKILLIKIHRQQRSYKSFKQVFINGFNFKSIIYIPTLKNHRFKNINMTLLMPSIRKPYKKITITKTIFLVSKFNLKNLPLKSKTIIKISQTTSTKSQSKMSSNKIMILLTCKLNGKIPINVPHIQNFLINVKDSKSLTLSLKKATEWHP